MANPQSDRNETIIRSILFLAVVLVAIGIIIFLKRSSDIPLTPEGFAARDSARRMATPDTTAAPSEEYPNTNTLPAEETDTVGVDQRIPSDAGYQDGYYTGLQDGIDDMERASYDDSSQFPTPAQRRNYADAYKRGYAQGFADGQSQGEEMPAEEEHPSAPAPAPQKPNAPVQKANAPTNKPSAPTQKSNSAAPKAH